MPNKGGPLPGRRFWAFVAAGFAAFFGATSVLFVWPATDQPHRVDAILSLNGGDEQSRENLAISLAQKGYSHVLLFSLGNSHTTPCPRLPRLQVVCFVAVPGRTAGEVKFAARYLQRHRWSSLIIVPSRPQATRARLLVKRCFSGRVYVVPASVDLVDLPYDVVYEWGAIAKALFIYRQC